ncbi:MAG: trigger factor [Candidatus Hydrogenedentes bacterium]|nr:trigger factor [Candidatus Hydrogenedentota bacterium]
MSPEKFSEQNTKAEKTQEETMEKVEQEVKGEELTSSNDKLHKHSAENEEEFKFEQAPTFEVEYKGECLYQAKISIPAVNSKVETAKYLEKLKEEATIRGFRKGKAPMWLLENKFGKAAKKEVREKLISEAWKKLIEENKFKLFSTPRFEGIDDIEEIPEDQDIHCVVNFEVAPKCELGKYRNLELERVIFEPNENIINERLEALRTRYSIYESVSNTEAQENDQVIIDFNGTIDGQAFQGGTATNYPYILGSNRFFGKFDEALMGSKVGDIKTCEVEFPEDYSNKSLAGKKAIFEIKVKDIKRKQLPELNDEFAKQLGSETLDELKQKIKKELENSILQESNRKLEQDAILKITENSTFEIPKSFIEEVTKGYIEDEINKLRQMRIPNSEIEKQREKLEQDAHEKALRMIKWFTVVHEIAEAEGIEVTEEDYENEAQNIQRGTGIDLDTIKSYIQNQGKGDVTDTIIRKKVLQLIINNAKITDRVVTQEEWEKIITAE